MEGLVFVVAMLKSPAKLFVPSGNSLQAFEAMAVIKAFKIPMGVWPQKFESSKEIKAFISDTSMKDIVETSVRRIYNFKCIRWNNPKLFNHRSSTA
jgi:hypothetical protein